MTNITYQAAVTNRIDSDALGSIVALTDPNKAITTEYDYQPFGVTTNIGASNKNAYKFTAREDDGTGLYYYRARYYHPALGRFVSEDPLEYGGGDAELFMYVGDDPISDVDPTGEGPVDWVITGEWSPSDAVRLAAEGGFREGVRDAAAGEVSAFTFGIVEGAFGSDACSAAYRQGRMGGAISRDLLLTAAGVGLANKLGLASNLANTQRVGRASRLFGRARFGQQGVLNSGSIRIGWGWKSTSGEVFRVAMGSPTRSRVIEYVRHIDIFY